MCKRVFFLCLWMLCLCASALAGEVRILDVNGLVRSMRLVPGQARVEISLRDSGASAPDGLTLRNADGTEDNLRSSERKGKTYIFTGVGSGSWHVEESVGIAGVTISAE